VARRPEEGVLLGPRGPCLTRRRFRLRRYLALSVEATSEAMVLTTSSTVPSNADDKSGRIPPGSGAANRQAEDLPGPVTQQKIESQGSLPQSEAALAPVVCPVGGHGA